MATVTVRNHKQNRVESTPVQSDSQRHGSYGRINNVKHSLRAKKHDSVEKKNPENYIIFLLYSFFVIILEIKVPYL